MVWNISANSTKGWQINLLAVSLRFLFIVLILIFVITLQVSAQMGSGTTYSDTWIDTSVSGGLVIGSGVTDESYNTYNHEAWVNVTLTSSSGQTATAGAGQQGGGGYGTFARADAVLPLNEADEFFDVEAEHGYFCAIAFRDTNLGTTFVTADVITHSYKKDFPATEYVPTCCSPCTIVPRYTPVGVNAPFTQCVSFLVRGRGCAVGAICINRQMEGICRPNTGRLPPLCQ